MIKINIENAILKKVITNQVGNKLREEEYDLSPELSEVDPDSHDYLKKYFLSQFQLNEIYNFTHPNDLELNEAFVLVRNLFSNTSKFVEKSHDFTKLLYEKSIHPKIKPGELNVVEFGDVLIDDELFDAIGIFKSETNVPFISINKVESGYGIQHKFGYELKGIDKGCLIVNTNSESGYLVLKIDKASGEAQYWVDDFLRIKPMTNEFSDTKAFMEMTKKFLSEELIRENEFEKTEQFDLINKTVDFFKTNEVFEKEEFEQSVLRDEKVIDSFRNYTPLYSEENQVDISDSFEISNPAVKKQARKFKSILKLDNNFQIYIKGDNSLIQKGVEANGSKYYKIYYENEE